MQAQRSPRSGDAVQRAVLALALAVHPKPLSAPLLAAEIRDANAVEEAAGTLCEVGLLDRDGDSLTASAAAVHFDRLGL